MKLQVVFLKKKFSDYTLVIIVFAITLSFFLFFTNNSISTFNIIDETKMLQSDLTGDGTKDILYIKTDTDKYYIQINSEDKSYYLDPSEKIKTVGNFYVEWPMRLTLMDISRNNVPEIFTQASIDNTATKNNKPIQHVFLWNGEKFDDIFCSNNSILGFVDSKNSKTPKVLSGNIKDGKMNFVSRILIKNNLKPFDYNYADNYMGKETVLGFINLMHSFPLAELNISKDMFAPGLSGNDISLLNDLSSRKVYFNFQDAVFKDNDWDKDGNANQILWTLNFKGTNAVDVKEIKNYTIELTIKPTPNNNVSTFKITSINIK
jgi:hypothetical protein